MAKGITIREISEALANLGFEGPSRRNGYLVFEHSKTGTLVALPGRSSNAIVGPSRLAAIRLSIIARDVATASEFDEALGAVHA